MFNSMVENLWGIVKMEQFFMEFELDEKCNYSKRFILDFIERHLEKIRKNVEKAIAA